MPKKVLFCATVDYHFKAFHLPYLKWFKEQGWEVHIAASGNLELPFVDKKYNIPIHRSPFNKMNISAYKKFKKIIDENQYKIIHCHTPMGGVLTRLAAISSRKSGTKVLYTAHGFHFCKGAPLINWLLYYPIEKFLSGFTDCLITINQEDFQIAQDHHFKAGMIKHVHGVGVNTDVFKPINEADRNMLRKSLGYKPNDFLIFYAAEFNKNKNQQLLIRSLSIIKNEVPHTKLLLAGDGSLLKECQELAVQLGVDGMVDFLGFRNDVEQLLKICDLAVGSSLREGLPVNIMEAMACGLPVVATENRGHKELIQNNVNGRLIEQHDLVYFANNIKILSENDGMRLGFGINSRKIILSSYSLNKILDDMKIIYQLYMDEMEEGMWAVH